MAEYDDLSESPEDTLREVLDMLSDEYAKIEEANKDSEILYVFMKRIRQRINNKIYNNSS